MLSLYLRNLFFTILQPGIVAGLIPYFIIRDSGQSYFTLDQIHHFVGLFLFTTGLLIMLHCIFSFAVKGKGTLSPVDRTKHLVVSGLYRYSRNPMYIGVVLILIGESIFFGSQSLWIYTVVVFLVFNLFILLIEEPRLKRDFGDEYDEYRSGVGRWL